MSDIEQPTGFWQRIKRWFTRGDRSVPHSHSIVHVRQSILPWKRAESEIADVQKSVETLAQVMLTVRDHLEQQAHQHEELTQQLARMNLATEGLPEGARTPDEAVRAIATQMAYQSQQQNRLANILEKISDTTGEHGKALHSLMDRMESVEHHGQIMGENVQSMGIVLQTVNRNSEQSAQSVATIQEHSEHHTQMHQLTYRQEGWLMVLLISTLVVVLASLIAAIVFGVMILHQERLNRPAVHTTLIPSHVFASV